MTADSAREVLGAQPLHALRDGVQVDLRRVEHGRQAEPVGDPKHVTPALRHGRLLPGRAGPEARWESRPASAHRRARPPCRRSPPSSPPPARGGPRPPIASFVSTAWFSPFRWRPVRALSSLPRGPVPPGTHARIIDLLLRSRRAWPARLKLAPHPVRPGSGAPAPSPAPRHHPRPHRRPCRA